MRIAYVYDVIYPYVKGGAQKRIWELSTRLTAKGHQVTIFGMKHWEGADIMYKEGVRLWGVCPPQDLFVNGHRSMKEAIYVGCRTLPALSREEYDIIDCQNFPYFPCFSARIASTLRSSPLLITWHEVWDDYWKTYLGRAGVFGRLVERLTTRLAPMNAVGTIYNRDKLISIGANENKVSLVPIGGISFSDIEKVSPARESVDVIFVGRLVKSKGVDTLLHSIAHLREIPRKVSVAIVGGGPERENLEALSRDLGIQDTVRFFGRVEDDGEVISIMKSARVFVYPAEPEGGWSLSIIEANACGLPAISVRSGPLGTNEVVIDGHNGLLVADQSAPAIAEKIHLILEDEPLRARLSQNAVIAAKEQDWGNVTEKTEKLYCEMLSRCS